MILRTLFKDPPYQDSYSTRKNALAYRSVTATWVYDPKTSTPASLTAPRHTGGPSPAWS